MGTQKAEKEVTGIYPHKLPFLLKKEERGIASALITRKLIRNVEKDEGLQRCDSLPLRKYY